MIGSIHRYYINLLSTKSGPRQNGAKYTNPGIYWYQLNESTGSYAGLDYGIAENYLVKVYVNKDGNTCSVSSVQVVNPDVLTKTKQPNFTSDYTTYNLTVTKKVEGAFADTSSTNKFSIAAAVTKPEATTGISVYNYNDTVTDWDGVSRATELANDESFTVYGIPAGYGYSVSEAESKGYQSNIDYPSGTISGNEDVTVTNTLASVTPTGIAHMVAPFALMVGLVAAFAVLFFRRRVEE